MTEKELPNATTNNTQTWPWTICREGNEYWPMQHIKVTRRALCCLSVSRKLNIPPVDSRVSSRQADAMRTRGWRDSDALPSSCLPARWSASGAAATRSLIRQPKRVLSGFPGLLSLFWRLRGPSSGARHEEIRGKNERAGGGKCLRLQIRMKLDGRAVISEQCYRISQWRDKSLLLLLFIFIFLGKLKKVRGPACVSVFSPAQLWGLTTS